MAKDYERGVIVPAPRHIKDDSKKRTYFIIIYFWQQQLYSEIKLQSKILPSLSYPLQKDEIGILLIITESFYPPFP